MSAPFTSSAALAIALFFGGIACSDSSDNPNPSNAGSGGASGGRAGATGSASAGRAGRGGSAGRAGVPSGSSGAAGSRGGVAGGSVGLDADAGLSASNKLVALTFDDGPNLELTAAVLDKLELYDVPASLFLIGQNISANTQPVLQRAASLGCTFENHSSGFASLTGMSADAVAASVNATTEAIEEFTDDSPVFFRPPNLAVDQNMLDTIDLPFASGLVGGDFPGGNAGGNPTIQSVTTVILNGVEDGTIILLHDVQPSLNPQVTPDALDVIIPTLQRQGFEFVNLRQLFERRGVDPNVPENMVWTAVPPN